MSVPPPIPKEQGEFSRLIGVFVSPKEAFADIARRPRWWVPMVLLMIATVATLVTYSQRVGWERITRQAIEQNANTQNMSAQQREQIIERGTQAAKYFAYVGAIGPAVFMVLTSALLVFIVDSLMGGAIGFNRMMGIIGYASMPGVLYTALVILVMYLKSPEDFDLNNPLAFNAAVFLPDGSARWLVILLSSFDLFSFWRIGLMGMGITAAAPKIRFGKALVAVLFLWGVYVLVRTGATAAFS